MRFWTKSRMTKRDILNLSRRDHNICVVILSMKKLLSSIVLGAVMLSLAPMSALAHSGYYSGGKYYQHSHENYSYCDSGYRRANSEVSACIRGRDVTFYGNPSVVNAMMYHNRHNTVDYVSWLIDGGSRTDVHHSNTGATKRLSRGWHHSKLVVYCNGGYRCSWTDPVWFWVN